MRRRGAWTRALRNQGHTAPSFVCWPIRCEGGGGSEGGAMRRGEGRGQEPHATRGTQLLHTYAGRSGQWGGEREGGRGGRGREGGGRYCVRQRPYCGCIQYPLPLTPSSPHTAQHCLPSLLQPIQQAGVIASGRAHTAGVSKTLELHRRFVEMWMLRTAEWRAGAPPREHHLVCKCGGKCVKRGGEDVGSG